MDVRHPAVLRVLDRDHRARRGARADRVERVLEGEARQRQAVGVPLERGAVRVGSRRTLEGDRARGLGGGGFAHRFDEREGGGGVAVHGPSRVTARRAADK
jgi:hypothetical protein